MTPIDPPDNERAGESVRGAEESVNVAAATRSIVVGIQHAQPHPAAIEMAFRMARAMRSAVHGLIFEDDDDLVAAAELEWCREVRFLSGQRVIPARGEIAHALSLAHASARRMIEQAARRAGIETRIIRSTVGPGRAFATQLPSGAILVLPQPYGARTSDLLRTVLTTRPDIAGVLLVGTQTRRTSGPVVVVAEERSEIERLASIAAELAAANGFQGRTPGSAALEFLAIGSDPINVREAARRIVAAQQNRERAEEVKIVLSMPSYGDPAVIAESVRRRHAGLMIGQLTGLLTPGGGTLRRLLASIDCPVLLVR